ncbi:teichoic acid D-Ala incorporation-associated protein DltX [Lactobacillus sp. PV034]|uniref:teichoic acid D-Ala incorporation-associated protein DltX n=1 Tax=Lactobacillus sp. PV034 TaxID=2594495 RepID=UPI00223EDABE|nr:teichoic acid D-Ala incorporation-associated protein DltX [Lactobacillus sp. PV034]QNQ81198.1 teichoic acid D-Ala incorporation-associated protein DltX [Lactobacillus sp. PV034]
MADKSNNESLTTKNSRAKNIGLFIGKTLFYFAILVVLVYLYSYTGVGGAKFIYKDF